MDYHEFEEQEIEQEKAFRDIDSDYDLVNAKIDATMPYQGAPKSYLRLWQSHYPT